MSEEVFEIVCSMDRRKVELQIVLQCAPTLAGLKTSNLLILPTPTPVTTQAVDSPTPTPTDTVAPTPTDTEAPTPTDDPNAGT